MSTIIIPGPDSKMQKRERAEEAQTAERRRAHAEPLWEAPEGDPRLRGCSSMVDLNSGGEWSYDLDGDGPDVWSQYVADAECVWYALPLPEPRDPDAMSVDLRPAAFKAKRSDDDLDAEVLVVIAAAVDDGEPLGTRGVLAEVGGAKPPVQASLRRLEAEGQIVQHKGRKPNSIEWRIAPQVA